MEHDTQECNQGQALKVVALKRGPHGSGRAQWGAGVTSEVSMDWFEEIEGGNHDSFASPFNKSDDGGNLFGIIRDLDSPSQGMDKLQLI